VHLQRQRDCNKPRTGIDSGFFYIAMLRAILTEIWVFQFLRVGVENVVHCFTHMLHGHKAENDAAHPSASYYPTTLTP
jgi:uncharacterized protein YcsI (UPF0317 family)